MLCICDAFNWSGAVVSLEQMALYGDATCTKWCTSYTSALSVISCLMAVLSFGTIKLTTIFWKLSTPISFTKKIVVKAPLPKCSSVYVLSNNVHIDGDTHYTSKNMELWSQLHVQSSSCSIFAVCVCVCKCMQTLCVCVCVWIHVRSECLKSETKSADCCSSWAQPSTFNFNFTYLRFSPFHVSMLETLQWPGPKICHNCY